MTVSSRDPLGITGSVIAEKYRMGEAIGEGGFSVVYRAEHTIWQQPVAIKCFKVLANAPEDQRQKLLDGFLQEGKLMAQLSSRSAAIVQARDVGTFTTPDGQWIPYMVLEWLEGKPLDVVLFEEHRAGWPARTPEEAVRLLEPAAVALEIVHGRNIAHRDIKPANIFVLGNARSPDAHIKVLDFGIAKVMADHAAAAVALAQTGREITAFTPNYGAPEQFTRTHGATGPWTDVFAMALILVEMLRGGLPALDGDDLMQLAIASRDPHRRPTPRTFGVQVSDAVEQVFLTALAVNPGDRYRTMGQFWAALHHAISPTAQTWTPQGQPSPGSNPSYDPNLARGAVPSAPFPAGTGPYTAPPGAPMTNQGGAPMTNQGSPPVTATGNATSVPAASSPTPQRSARSPFAALGLLAVALIAGGAGAYKVFGGGGPAPSASATASAPVASASASASGSAMPAVATRPTECPKDMVLVSGGKFFMGSDDASFKLWQPAHKVTLDTFCIDVNEVTAGDYKACSDIGECKRADPVPDYPKTPGATDEQHEKAKKANAEFCNFGKDDRANHPMNCVPWALADAYCKVKKKRLPTEAEWEYAARGSDGRKFPWGDEPGDEKHMNACGPECNKWEAAHGLKLTPRMYEADDGFPGTAPVGSFPKGKTKFGANDFVGNVWEWTSDWFEAYKDEEQVNPKGAPAGDRKVIRGGGYNGGVQLWLNPAFRYFQIATASAPGIGFRCAMSL